MELSGKDGTECFDDQSHSADAQALCKQYRIGKLKEVRQEQLQYIFPSKSSDVVRSVTKTKFDLPQQYYYICPRIIP